MNNGLYFTTDGKNYQKLTGEATWDSKDDFWDFAEKLKNPPKANLENTAAIAIDKNGLSRVMIPRGQRNREILRRDGYLSPKNADFARGVDE